MDGWWVVWVWQYCTGLATTLMGGTPHSRMDRGDYTLRYLNSAESDGHIVFDSLVLTNGTRTSQ